MRTTPTWRRYLRFWGNDPAGDAQDEISFHFDMRVQDLMRAGLGEGAARARAEAEFGDAIAIRRELTELGERRAQREHRRGLIDDGLQDVRFGIRSLWASKVFAATAIITLGLSIGGTAAVFSAVDTLLLRSLPFANADRLVSIWSRDPSADGEPFTSSPPDFREIASRSRSFDAMAAFYTAAFNVVGPDGAERIDGVHASPELMRVLGTAPALGRDFVADDAIYGATTVVLLSHDYWLRRFNADPAVIGRTLTVNNSVATVIGVMPRGFAFPDRTADAWSPMTFAPDDASNTRGNYFLEIIGRLAPGVTREQAEREVDGIGKQIRQTLPSASIAGAQVDPLRERYAGEIRRPLYIVLAAVLLVLLIACVNIASLLYARSDARRREISVRSSLGATPRRVVRQLLTESAVLACLGTALGLAIAWAALRAYNIAAPAELTSLAGARLDVRVLAFSLIVCTACTVLFGLMPALFTVRRDMQSSMRQAGRVSASRQSRRIRELLIAAELCFAVVLVVGASLLARSFARVVSVDTGFRTENLTTFSIAFPESEYPRADQLWSTVDRMLERIRALPGVTSATATSGLSLAGGGWGKQMTTADQPLPKSMDEVSVVSYRVVDATYFETLQVPLHAGRVFTADDRAGRENVIVINETLARKHFAGQDPIGKILWLGPPEELIASRLRDGFRFPRLRVVGVVADERFAALDVAPDPEVYLAYAQSTETPSVMYIAVRGRGDAASIIAPIRAAITEIAPASPLADVATMDDRVAQSLTTRKLQTTLLLIFAAMALALAVIGIYGVVASAVMERKREISVRIALGATKHVVLGMIVRGGMLPVIVGLIAGVIVASAATRALQSMLFGVEPLDPATLVGAPLMLMIAASVAVLIPARKALQSDPAATLRSD